MGPGPPKQLRPIAGVPLLLRALRPFLHHPRVREIVVALPADLVTSPPRWLGDLAEDGVRLVVGGGTRAASVLAALRGLASEVSIVLVHDGVRPFVSADTVDAVIARAAEGQGAVAALPVGDTLKRADGEGRRIVETVDRTGLWRAQTPQGFPRAMLEAAYRAAAERDDLAATDDAALVEAAGFSVTLVPDRSTNIKVTTDDDLLLAEALAAR